MTRAQTEAKLQQLLDRYDRRTDTANVAFVLNQPSTAWTWSYGDSGAAYFIASITKLYTVALILQLRQRRLVELDARVTRYLPPDTMRGLNEIEGVDRGPEVTVRQLLAHTSGIGDYFEGRRADGGTTFERALAGAPGWSRAEAIEIARDQVPAAFAPGTPGRASYSDTNYQLLGAIIEAVTGDTYDAALTTGITAPLGLERTWLFTPATLDRYDTVSPLLMDTHPIRIPQVMASVGADGGIVSTAAESMRFLRAFFAGELFPAADLAEMQATWRRIFFPLQYGMGVMRFALPRLMTGLRASPAMVGHSGASGAVAFYAPKIDLYVTGTVNQVRKRSLVYQLLTRVVMVVERAKR
jgi:CubicO group peptidase (beta-lactamase class C family)